VLDHPTLGGSRSYQGMSGHHEETTGAVSKAGAFNSHIGRDHAPSCHDGMAWSPHLWCLPSACGLELQEPSSPGPAAAWTIAKAAFQRSFDWPGRPGSSDRDRSARPGHIGVHRLETTKNNPKIFRKPRAPVRRRIGGGQKHDIRSALHRTRTTN
jgi:hypothetical protein